ncbi:hypothetical protein NSQ77_18185 [Oceanobacillus sp. FSL K6-2867]
MGSKKMINQKSNHKMIKPSNTPIVIDSSSIKRRPIEVSGRSGCCMKIR